VILRHPPGSQLASPDQAYGTFDSLWPDEAHLELQSRWVSARPLPETATLNVRAAVEWLIAIILGVEIAEGVKFH
jgi:hypothetical protein